MENLGTILSTQNLVDKCKLQIANCKISFRSKFFIGMDLDLNFDIFILHLIN